MKTSMAEVLRLTRDGRLMEATALLQRGLSGSTSSLTTQPTLMKAPSRHRAIGAGELLGNLQTRLPAALPGKNLLRPARHSKESGPKPVHRGARRAT